MTSDQKIVGYDVWHLALPVRSARDHGIGRVSGTCEIILLCLTSEDGTQGWGEASPWSVFTGSPEASFAALERYMRPHVVGRTLNDHEAIMAAAQICVAHCSEAKAALETALFDLAGRLAGSPVHAFLGGTCRDSIPLSVALANPDWNADLALLERLRDDGVGIGKLKTGFRDHAFDVMRLECLAQDWPSLRVRVDYNQGLTPQEARIQVPEVAGFKPDFIEQPVRAHHYDVMAELRGLIDVPLVADESVFGPEDMARAAREGICDAVSVKIMKSGGLRRGQEVAHLAALQGMPAYGGDMFEAGIAHLAGTHMIAATPEITLGCEFYQAQYYLVEDILSEPLRHKDGQVIVPNTPGLGYVPDPDKLRKYAIAS